MNRDFTQLNHIRYMINRSESKMKEATALNEIMENNELIEEFLWPGRYKKLISSVATMEVAGYLNISPNTLNLAIYASRLKESIIC